MPALTQLLELLASGLISLPCTLYKSFNASKSLCMDKSSKTLAVATTQLKVSLEGRAVAGASVPFDLADLIKSSIRTVRTQDTLRYQAGVLILQSQDNRWTHGRATVFNKPERKPVGPPYQMCPFEFASFQLERGLPYRSKRF